MNDIYYFDVALTLSRCPVCDNRWRRWRFELLALGINEVKRNFFLINSDNNKQRTAEWIHSDYIVDIMLCLKKKCDYIKV